MGTVTAVWTLWLIAWGNPWGSPVQGEGVTPAVTPLATFPTRDACEASLRFIGPTIKDDYKTDISPGLLFCVGGVPVKK